MTISTLLERRKLSNDRSVNAPEVMNVNYNIRTSAFDQADVILLLFFLEITETSEREDM